MPFIINTYDPQVFNQFTNGTNFGLNPSFFDKTFTGNVEKLRVQSDYEWTWYADSGFLSWNVQSGSIESTGQNFEIEGFDVGQIFEFYNDWAQRLTDTPEFTAQITAITNGGTLISFNVISGSQTTIDNTAVNVGIWADATQEENNMRAIQVLFGLPLQSEADTFNSKIDNTLQKYYINDILPSGEQQLTRGTPTQGQYTGQMTVQPFVATGKNAKRVRIKHDLIVNPFYLSTDTPDVLINPPSGDVKNIYSVDNVRFEGAECLRYIQELEVRSVPTNVRGRKATIRLDGNTGWFQDNFNTGSKQFELEAGSVIFNGGASTGLLFGQSNSIQFDIKYTNGLDIPANSPFGVYFSILPPESRYQNTSTDFQSNFVYDSAVQAEGAAPISGENSLFSNVQGVLALVSGVNMIRVTCDLDLTGTQAAFDDNYAIWAGAESPNADISEVSCNQVAKAGGEGVTDLTIALDAAGGVIAFDLFMDAIVDKAEIIHNGVKKATSSMLSVNNGGVFDPSSTASNFPDSQWYIGTNNGVIPTFYTDFELATGITTAPFTAGFQQRIWWIYTNADYLVNPNCVIRLSGVDGTYWRIKRICQ